MNRKIRRIFSIILVACMLLTIVQPHATFWAEEDSLTNELNEDEASMDSNASIESGENSYFELLSEDEKQNAEQELSSSTINEEVIEGAEIDDELESSLLSDNEDEVTGQENIVTITDEETEEPENDNWELGLVFYDSSVNNGKTPLTEINWDASDGSYKEGTPRVITVQINYKNTNTVTAYQQGELKISIPNLAYNTSENTDDSPYWDATVVVGANDSTHSGYDWDFETGTSPTTSQEIFIFSNANIIEEKSNFEGSIQIVYTITPANERNSNEYSDECTHNFRGCEQKSVNTDLL